MGYYTNLENLLLANKWKEADQETSRIILLVANQEKRGWLDYNDIEKFPSSELYMIDQLWLRYSSSRFGFSIQKGIWQEVNKKFDSERKLKFGERLGWRREGKWLSYYNLTFSTKAPIGHLPTWHIFGGFLGGFGLLSVLGTVDVTEKPIFWQQLRGTQTNVVYLHRHRSSYPLSSCRIYRKSYRRRGVISPSRRNNFCLVTL